MSMQGRRLRIARSVARAATAFCATMTALTAWMTLNPSVAVSAPAVGEATVVAPLDGTAASGQPLERGGSATAFTLRLPAGAACTGDSASGGYRVQSYMVLASVSPASLSFGATGPVPAGTGADFRQPLFDIDEQPYVNAQTDIATGGAAAGTISQIPAFSFAVYAPDGPSLVPAGTYNIGLACTRGPAGPDQLDKLWNAQVAVVADAADSPAGLRWSVLTTATTTTTTTAPTTTTTAPTTTTTAPTTTTTAPTTTTTTTAPTTTTTTAPTTTTTVEPEPPGPGGNNPGDGGNPGDGAGGFPPPEVLPAAVPAGPPAGGLGMLPVTGGPGWLAVWGVLLVTFGRIAVLLGRVPQPPAPARG